MTSKKLVLGGLLGIAAGTTIALLLMKDSKETKMKKLSKHGHQYAGDVEDQIGDLLKKVFHKIEGLKDEAKDIVKDGERKIERLIAEAASIAK